MKQIFTFLVALLISASAFSQSIVDGLNLPGSWFNNWQNPPDTPCFASEKVNTTYGQGWLAPETSLANVHYSTIFRVSTTLLAGTHNFKVISPGYGNDWKNQWVLDQDNNNSTGETVTFNQIQPYSYCSDCDPAAISITLNDGKWYVFNFADKGYASTMAIFMEMSDTPSVIQKVYYQSDVPENQDQVISVVLDKAPTPEEVVYIRYTTDNWSTFAMEQVTFTAVKPDSGTATISGISAGTTVEFYVLTTAYANVNQLSTSDSIDLVTIRFDNNSGNNYSYTVSAATNINDLTNIELYPNPATDFLNIKFKGEFDIYITDISGKLIKQFNNLMNKAALDISDLNPGVYLIKLVANEKTYTAKFIKQ